MRDENDGAALLIELLEELQHLVARFGVQRAGRLIRHDDGRVRRDGAGDGDTLLLAAGHLRWLIPAAVDKADALERLDGQLVPVVDADALIDKRQLDVLLHGERLDEVILLENKADLFVADARELHIAQLAHVRSLEQILAVGRHVEAAEHVHHRRFARTGLSDDGNELAPVDGKRNAVERADLALKALGVDLINVSQFDQFRHGAILNIPCRNCPSWWRSRSYTV